MNKVVDNFRSNSESKLQNFMSGSYLFTQYFEGLLDKFPSEILNKPVSSENIKLLDDVSKRVEFKEILSFYFPPTFFCSNFVQYFFT